MENVKDRESYTHSFKKYSEFTETTIQIQNGKLFVNGQETSNPEQIGFAILDIVEEIQQEEIICKAHLAFITDK